MYAKDYVAFFQDVAKGDDKGERQIMVISAETGECVNTRMAGPAPDGFWFFDVATNRNRLYLFYVRETNNGRKKIIVGQWFDLPSLDSGGLMEILQFDVPEGETMHLDIPGITTEPPPETVRKSDSNYLKFHSNHRTETIAMTHTHAKLIDDTRVFSAWCFDSSLNLLSKGSTPVGQIPMSIQTIDKIVTNSKGEGVMLIDHHASLKLGSLMRRERTTHLLKLDKNGLVLIPDPIPPGPSIASRGLLIVDGEPLIAGVYPNAGESAENARLRHVFICRPFSASQETVTIELEQPFATSSISILPKGDDAFTIFSDGPINLEKNSASSSKMNVVTVSLNGDIYSEAEYILPRMIPISGRHRLGRNNTYVIPQILSFPFFHKGLLMVFFENIRSNFRAAGGGQLITNQKDDKIGIGLAVFVNQMEPSITEIEVKDPHAWLIDLDDEIMDGIFWNRTLKNNGMIAGFNRITIH